MKALTWQGVNKLKVERVPDPHGVGRCEVQRAG